MMQPLLIIASDRASDRVAFSFCNRFWRETSCDADADADADNQKRTKSTLTGSFYFKLRAGHIRGSTRAREYLP
jgi:hypothetical protein